MQKKFNLAFAHSDPAAINAINGLIEFLADSKIDFSPTVFHFSRNIFYINEKKCQPQDLFQCFKDEHFDFVFTGTSVESNLEYELINLANLQNITSISIIDHWINYKKRFERNGTIYFPSWILLNDDLAKNQAIVEGLPENKLITSGNPWWYKLAKIKAQLPLQNLPSSSNSILFLSDNLLETWGENTKDTLGYTEFEVLHNLVDIALQLNKKVFVRLHPKENTFKYNGLIRENKITISSPNIPLWEEVRMHEYVIGMFSNAIIDSSIFQPNTIRFEPGRKINLLPSNTAPEVFSKERLQSLFMRKHAKYIENSTPRFDEKKILAFLNS